MKYDHLVKILDKGARTHTYARIAQCSHRIILFVFKKASVLIKIRILNPTSNIRFSGYC